MLLALYYLFQLVKVAFFACVVLFHIHFHDIVVFITSYDLFVVDLRCTIGKNNRDPMVLLYFLVQFLRCDCDFVL